ncbi:MAG: serine--tRNA ligase [Fervidicoccaceae archaeon]
MPKWTVIEMIRSFPDKYIEMVKKRGLDASIVNEAIEIDKRYRDLVKEVEQLRRDHNQLSRSISKAKSDEEKKELLRKAKELEDILIAKENEVSQAEMKWRDAMKKLPNILADDVPIGFSDEENVPVRFWGKPKVLREKLDDFFNQTRKWGFNVDYELIEGKELIGHADILEKVLKMGDTLQAAKVAGSRFYYLIGDIVWLDFAISMYALDLLTKKGYTPVIPPYMLRTEVLEGAIDYSSFKDMIYKIEGEDLNLIGTAEHPLMALAYENPLREQDLPLKLVGWSPCFRKEAGAGNRDIKGIFRVHQFHKIEQFVFAHPSDSWKYLDEMVENTEGILKGLELPYRVVNVVSGELGLPAAKKYDIEVWYPAQGKYREIASISQVLDWQAFRANLTYLRASDGKREYLHTLNGTGIPTSRAITAILENFQEPDGRVIVPKILRKYLEPIERAPIDELRPREK